MSKSENPSSEERGSIGRSIRPIQSFGKTLALGGALYLGMYAAGGVGDAIEGELRNSARAEAMEMIHECRDAVLCTLGKISLANGSQIHL